MLLRFLPLLVLVVFCSCSSTNRRSQPTTTPARATLRDIVFHARIAHRHFYETHSIFERSGRLHGTTTSSQLPPQTHVMFLATPLTERWFAAIEQGCDHPSQQSEVLRQPFAERNERIPVQPMYDSAEIRVAFHGRECAWNNAETLYWLTTQWIRSHTPEPRAGTDPTNNRRIRVLGRLPLSNTQLRAPGDRTCSGELLFDEDGSLSCGWDCTTESGDVRVRLTSAQLEQLVPVLRSAAIPNGITEDSLRDATAQEVLLPRGPSRAWNWMLLMAERWDATPNALLEQLPMCRHHPQRVPE